MRRFRDLGGSSRGARDLCDVKIAGPEGVMRVPGDPEAERVFAGWQEGSPIISSGLLEHNRPRLSGNLPKRELAIKG
jgi:hypothetical protein